MQDSDSEYQSLKGDDAESESVAQDVESEPMAPDQPLGRSLHMYYKYVKEKPEDVKENPKVVVVLENDEANLNQVDNNIPKELKGLALDQTKRRLITYIFDKRFEHLHNKNTELIPKGWKSDYDYRYHSRDELIGGTPRQDSPSATPGETAKGTSTSQKGGKNSNKEQESISKDGSHGIQMKQLKGQDNLPATETAAGETAKGTSTSQKGGKNSNKEQESNSKEASLHTGAREKKCDSSNGIGAKANSNSVHRTENAERESGKANPTPKVEEGTRENENERSIQTSQPKFPCPFHKDGYSKIKRKFIGSKSHSDETRQYLHCSDVVVICVSSERIAAEGDSTCQPLQRCRGKNLPWNTWQTPAYAWLKEALETPNKYRRGAIVLVHSKQRLTREMEIFRTRKVWKLFKKNGPACPIVCGVLDFENSKEKLDDLVNRMVQFCIDKFKNHTNSCHHHEEHFSIVEPSIPQEVQFGRLLFAEAFFTLLLFPLPTVFGYCGRKCCKNRCTDWIEDRHDSEKFENEARQEYALRKADRYCTRGCRVKSVRTIWGHSKDFYTRCPWFGLVDSHQANQPIADFTLGSLGWRAVLVTAFLGFFVYMIFCIKYGIFRKKREDEDDMMRDKAHEGLAFCITAIFFYASWAATKTKNTSIPEIRHGQELYLAKKGYDMQTPFEKLDGIECFRCLNIDVEEGARLRGLVQHSTTGELSMALKLLHQDSMRRRWRLVSILWGLFSFILHCGVSALVLVDSSEKDEINKLNNDEIAWFWCSTVATGMIFGTGIYFTLYKAGGSLFLANKLMNSLTRMLEQNYEENEPISACRSCMTCRCGNFRERYNEPEHYFPVIFPENLFGWLSMRQDLFRYANFGFVESGGLLLVPILFTAFAIGYTIVLWIQDENFILHTEVALDILVATVVVLYVSYNASRLENIQNRQTLLLSNYKAALQKDIHRLQCESILCEEGERGDKPGIYPIDVLRKSLETVKVVQAFVRDNTLLATIWPGIPLTRARVSQISIALVGLVPVIFEYLFFSKVRV